MQNVFLSEIRTSEIRELFDKVRRRNYGRYLLSVKLEFARSFRAQTVRFDFPVTALIGPNGGGKSTVLGAAACAYKIIKPGLFFPKSAIGDNTMADWSFEYDVIDKPLEPNGTVRRSSNFKRHRWNRDRVLERPVQFFGINRTVPAAEKTRFKKLMSPSYRHTGQLTALQEVVAQESERILGKSVRAFRVADLSDSETFYVGGDGQTEYSEFHFGAGEASIIRMVSEIEASPENALILIEEIENGLHPVATRRMVEYLISVARRKNIQAIFTTHSDFALDPLPSEAIWASIDGRVQQGKLSIQALRAVSGRIDRRLAIFVEDEFAKAWVEAMLREVLGQRMEQVAVYAVAGDGNAVRTNRGHRENPAIAFSSLCFIDGDSSQQEDQVGGIWRLPGQVPETKIFDDVIANLDQNISLLTVSCQRPPAREDEVRRAVQEVSQTNRDPHLLFNQVGMKIGWMPASTVRGAFLSVWITENNAIVAALMEPVSQTLDQNQ